MRQIAKVHSGGEVLQGIEAGAVVATVFWCLIAPVINYMGCEK